jgi:prefoldin subunit 5
MRHFILVFSALLFLGSLTIVPVAALAASETVKGAKKDFAEFKETMGKKIDTMEKQIAELKEKAKQKGGEAHAKTVAELEASRDKLKSEFAELKEDSQEGWKGLKEKLSSTADSLNQKIQKALKE